MANPSPNLTVGMHGEAVARVHANLIQLAFDIDRSEVAKRRFGPSTRDAVLRFQREHGLRPTGEVDEETARRIHAALDRPEEEPTEDTFVVRGRVRNPDGSPIPRVVVKAFDASLRKETRLGEGMVTAEGAYEIRFGRDKLQPAAKPAADLIVRAYDEAGNELARSELLCRAPSEAVVDLVVGNRPLLGPSEYQTLVATIQPYLQETALADLEREDVQFLVCSAPLDPRQVATLIVANRLTRETSLPDWLFYALGRQEVRLQLEAMVLLRRQVLEDAVSAAIQANIVPPSDGEAVSALLDRLQSVLARTAFDAPRAGAAFSIGGLLGTSLVSRKRQEAFLARYLVRPESPEEFWNGLEKDKRFSKEAIDDLSLTLMLGKLTDYRLPVLEQLKRLRESGEVSSIRDLVRLDRARWREMLHAAGEGDGLELPEDIPGETPEERLEHYITSLRAPIEALFPSDSLRRALTRAPVTDPNVALFITHAEDLDLYWTNIDAYLGEHREAVLSGIAPEDHETVVARVKGLQRLLRVSPRADHVRVMDVSGFDSALAVARAPKGRFQRRFVEGSHKLQDTLDDAYMVLAPTQAAGSESGERQSMMVLSGEPPEAVADGLHASAVKVASYHLQQYVNLHAALQSWPAAVGGPEDLQKKLREEAYQ